MRENLNNNPEVASHIQTEIKRIIEAQKRWQDRIDALVPVIKERLSDFDAPVVTNFFYNGPSQASRLVIEHTVTRKNGTTYRIDRDVKIPTNLWIK